MSSDIRKKLDDLASRMPGDSEDKEHLRKVVRKLRDESSEKRKSRPAIRYHRDRPRNETRTTPAQASSDEVVELHAAVDGAESHVSGRGCFYVVENALCDIEDEAGHLQRDFTEALDNPDSGLRQRLSDLWPADGLEPDDIIFMDLETTGLACSPLFLIGTMCWEQDRLVVRQLLARDYSEESAIVARFADGFARRRLLVTFNGKSFDMPFLRMRAASTRVELPEEPPHFDLLHVCRRVWKDSLPNCKLQTLETHICRRPRYGDIPGEQIPEAYHAFVRTGDARRMVRILHHNMLDLVTMADLMVRLPPAQ